MGSARKIALATVEFLLNGRKSWLKRNSGWWNKQAYSTQTHNAPLPQFRNFISRKSEMKIKLNSISDNLITFMYLQDTLVFERLAIIKSKSESLEGISSTTNRWLGRTCLSDRPRHLKRFCRQILKKQRTINTWDDLRPFKLKRIISKMLTTVKSENRLEWWMQQIVSESSAQAAWSHNFAIFRRMWIHQMSAVLKTQTFELRISKSF